MPSNRNSNCGNYAVVDANMRSTGPSAHRRFKTEAQAETVAKRMLNNGDETSPVFVVKLVSKVEAPQSHRVTRIS